MNFALWVIAGAALGWVGFSVIGWNTGRSLVVSMVLGTIGGFFGGKILAPMFTTPEVPPSSDFAMAALVIAIVTSLVFLVVADQTLKRWDI